MSLGNSSSRTSPSLLSIAKQIILLKCVHAIYGGVFKTKFLLRMNQPEGALCHQRSFMKSTKDQLQFSGICVDVTNSKYTGDIGGIVYRIHVNSTLIQVQTPVSKGAKLRTKTKKRDQVICLQLTN